ncbi:MAG TPA: NAD-dependent epimerase/dehydratase family protein [Bacteroidota bacterium]|nr:NAD-dependent epimerase/dehydratase family protein [Bacteroidota bacterium]
MKILVTGGAGFIGSHVVDAYLMAGHQVVVIDDLSSGTRENLNPKAKFYQVDIRSDQIEGIFQREKFDVVNHHAAQMDVRRSVADPKYDASVNIMGTLNLLESSRRNAVKQVIFASTGGAIYGEQEQFPADEEHPQQPLSPYGVAKLAVEKYLFVYQAVHGLRFVSLRYANVYGPRQNPFGEAGVVAIFAHKMLKGEQPIINGDGKQTRDYVYIADVVRANLLALECPRSEIYNVGTGVETDVNQLFKKLRKYLKPDCKEEHGPPKSGEQQRSVISYAKIKKELGWMPETKLEEGLYLTAEYFKQKQVVVS